MNISLTENNNTIFQMSENEPSSEDECKTGCIMLYIFLCLFFTPFVLVFVVWPLCLFLKYLYRLLHHKCGWSFCGPTETRPRDRNNSVSTISSTVRQQPSSSIQSPPLTPSASIPIPTAPEIQEPVINQLPRSKATDIHYTGKHTTFYDKLLI